jgi:hypothetical protein
MSFDHIIAVIGAISGVFGIVFGAVGFWYGVWKDRKADRRFRKEKVEAIFNDLLKIMKRGMGGTYIPGLSEKAGQQLKDKVWSTLRWHLLPEVCSEYDKQVHEIAQHLEEGSKR